MIKRIIEMIQVSREQDQRKFLVDEALKMEKDKDRRELLELELENLGFMTIVICEQCNSYRSDLEWRGRKKKIKNCRKCGSNKITYPPVIPKRIILLLVLRYAIKGY